MKLSWPSPVRDPPAAVCRRRRSEMRYARVTPTELLPCTLPKHAFSAGIELQGILISEMKIIWRGVTLVTASTVRYASSRIGRAPTADGRAARRFVMRVSGRQDSNSNRVRRIVGALRGVEESALISMAALPFLSVSRRTQGRRSEVYAKAMRAPRERYGIGRTRRDYAIGKRRRPRA